MKNLLLISGKKGDKSEKKKKKKASKKFTEGWVEYEKKSVAKYVAKTLNNTQVDDRKKSIHFDYLWNIKYLSGFKWEHLNERLIYEKAAKRTKLLSEIQRAKKNAAFFTSNLNKKSDGDVINKEYENLEIDETSPNDTEEKSSELMKERKEFLGSLFG